MMLDSTGVARVQLNHSPQLLSDDGPAFTGEALHAFLKPSAIDYVCARHRQTQGESKCFLRSMKLIVRLNSFFPLGFGASHPCTYGPEYSLEHSSRLLNTDSLIVASFMAISRLLPQFDSIILKDVGVESVIPLRQSVLRG